MIEETNIKLEEGRIKDILVGSLDVEALYPSIDQKEGPRIVADEILKSPLKFESVDTHILGVYLATVMDKERQGKLKVREEGNLTCTERNWVVQEGERR